MIRFTIPIHTKWKQIQTENNASEVVYVKRERAKAQKGWVRGSLQVFGQKVPKLPATVTLTRISSGKLDPGNLPGSFKYVVDEIAAYLKHQGAPGNWWEEVAAGRGDEEGSGVTWKYEQQSAPRGRHAFRVEIEEDKP